LPRNLPLFQPLPYLFLIALALNISKMKSRSWRILKTSKGSRLLKL
jgi:hypothetical protein